MDITRCIYISSTGCSLYVDVARFAPGDHYLVGTVCLAAECAPSLKLDLLEAVTPVRSRVVEYLYHYNRSLYDELVEEVLPALHTHYSKDLTHHHCDPFDGPTRELFAGEEGQLLRSIDVGPGDDEAIATYRNGAAEAEMEWLPFLRMVRKLFLWSKALDP
ncbi:uncharacterized protein ACA1_055680 [Acanthamoeba castellanii str. Neff]|uniref:Uncharacterized protein n=1 Tax=Acanthamoeba castellanii (strain ATCC 30010 / Neff) TaxID=1257118 RepID=L8H6D8_ACACF|nr:uncharacterized protein ACA1_055680 [Acanthamoeba castellanii str. Neff]ELR20802.1 hypothetical protein ACA1_055680 [Acanthamoeba castellanii str. Neff]